MLQQNVGAEETIHALRGIGFIHSRSSELDEDFEVVLRVPGIETRSTFSQDAAP